MSGIGLPPRAMNDRFMSTSSMGISRIWEHRALRAPPISAFPVDIIQFAVVPSLIIKILTTEFDFAQQIEE